MNADEARQVDPFTQWCRDEVFTPAMVRAAELMERVCDMHLAGIYRKLELGRLLSEPRTGAELADALGFVPSAAITLEAMLWRMGKRSGDVAILDEFEPPRFQAMQQPDDASEDLIAARAEIESLGPGFRAGLEFLDFGAGHFVRALRDEPDLLDRVLSGREPALAELWERATNMDPLQDVHGEMGARAVSALFPGGIVLEIGGGTGNGVRHLFRTLAERGELERIENYVFTDISMPFILKTRRDVKPAFPAVNTDWRFLDINRPFAKQKVFPESVDLIYGVNAAHVATDIVEFLRECHRALRPSGQVIFSERVRLEPRMMAPRELTLNLSVYHRTAALRNPDYRSTHCYLAPDGWLRALALAGFGESEICPDLDAMRETIPSPYAAIVLARKTAIG